MRRGVGHWRAFVREEGGSVTLEASMIFPWVLLLTFLLILFAVVLNRYVLNFYSASVTVERAAFSWSNSAKELRTGAYPNGQYDGLYWRLKDDALLAGLFGWNHEQESVRVPVEPGMPGDEGYTPEQKLRKSGHLVTGQIQGTLSYRNEWWKRIIAMETAGTPVPQPLRAFRGKAGQSSEVAVSAVVVEPAELIRSFDLVRYYKAQISGKGQGADSFRSKAAAVLERKR
ncbi:pilus assembly protein [Cohnella pontilimi]|uniref:Pilus assembly protein n=1 Tax=Cohnella pontilimi TaxID=2564100 RepID=A0A4U0F874_9BACL|nr:pilus assembly protein [Cohnella pontilimi]TJY40923.1 pilus assembly protein [Cohnella pontilimi]